MKKIFFILNCFILSSQTINLNEINIINDLRIEQISGIIDPDLSFNIKPFSINNYIIFIIEENFMGIELLLYIVSIAFYDVLLLRCFGLFFNVG